MKNVAKVVMFYFKHLCCCIGILFYRILGVGLLHDEKTVLHGSMPLWKSTITFALVIS